MLRRLVALLSVLALVALLTTTATGTPTQADGFRVKTDKVGDVRAKGLALAQRKALDLKSVRVYGDSRVGVLVQARFAGNVAGQLGQGKLKKGGVALVLNANTGFASAGFYTFGSGPFGDTLHLTRSTMIGVLRHGNGVDFFISGNGWPNVGSLQVETFAMPPFTPPSSPEASGNLTTEDLQAILHSSSPADLDVLTHGFLGAGGLDDLSCAELENLIPAIDQEIANAAAAEAAVGKSEYADETIAALRHMKADAQEALDYDCPPPGGTQLLFDGWWQHHGPGDSDVCAEVSTKPAWPGGSGTISVSGPGVVGGTGKTFTLDADGTATIPYQINQLGLYTFTYSATDKGQTLSGTSTVDVQSAQGSQSCP
jgi:hypothetical protein